MLHVIVVLPRPDELHTVTGLGEAEILEPGGGLAPASSLTWKVADCTVMAAERAALPAGLASTVKFTVPLPGPAPPVIFNHEAEAGAEGVQAHPDCVVTWKVPVPPVLGKFPLVGAMAYVQFIGGLGPASSLTWKAADCTVMAAERAALPAGLASIVKFTVPLPGPTPPVIFNHEADEGTEGVQVHPD